VCAEHYCKGEKDGMAEGNDTSAIGPLNATAQKEGNQLIGLIVLVMAVTCVALYVIGMIANAIS
jgi:hypothetical protein